MATKDKVTFGGETHSLGTDHKVSAQATWDLKSALTGTYLEKEQAFASGYDPSGLTTTAKTDGNCDTGFTIADNTIIDAAWDGGNAAASIVLPAATVGNYVVWRQTAAADGAGVNLVFTCASGEFFAGDQVLSTGTNLAVNNEITAATDNTLTIAVTSANNGWGEIGSSVVFFCRTAGYWLVKAHSVTLGTGAVGSINTTAV